MRKIKIISSAFLALSTLAAIIVPILSSGMQGYYKGQIDDLSLNTQLLLDKKQFWAELGETPLFLYILLAAAMIFTAVLITTHKKGKNPEK